jgi:glycosyltransferase involved in cell wall biosynthesis
VKLIYTAAHAGFGEEAVPLGGGGAVADQLIRQWAGTDLEVLSPVSFGSNWPTGRELVTFGESAYARFCYDFSRACTERILQANPVQTRVLVNDISEAPDFAALARNGFVITTIYHVDVVAYVAKIYLRDAFDPVFLTRLYDWFRPLYPEIARLVFEQQRQSLEHSKLVVVPSRPMRDLLLACYPMTPPARIRVLPWGHWLDPVDVSAEVDVLRAEWRLDPAKPTLLMLSRLSPEKGQDIVLQTLAQFDPDWQVIIAGGAAYMMGARFRDRLKALAARLKRTRVVFAGHVTGVRKQACFSLADLYVFPSRHESYGLTLLEALASGLPAVCLDHQGAAAVMKPEFGRVVREAGLRAALEEMVADPELRRKGASAKAWASQQRFEETAATLARWIRA